MNMKTPMLTLMTVLVLALSGCTGADNKVELLDDAQNASLPPDGDKDGLPDTLEAELCQRGLTRIILETAEVGTCDGDDLDARDDIVARVFLPTSAMRLEDDDGDDLPARVALQGSTLVIDPLSADRVRLETAQALHVADIDTDDNDRDQPAPSTVAIQRSVPVAFLLGEDKDGDDLPSRITIQFVHIEVDRRTGSAGITMTNSVQLHVPIDTDDTDAAEPVTDTVTASVPMNAWHTGDGDNDGLPGSLVLEWLELTVDRTTGAAERLSTHTVRSAVDVDPDDQDRDDVVPLSTIDADADLIADAAEPIICMVQRENDPSDGVCVRADGSGHDGSGNNYIPPADLAGLLDVMDKTAGPIVVADAGEPAAGAHDAPGLSGLAALALLGLVALARRP